MLDESAHPRPISLGPSLVAHLSARAGRLIYVAPPDEASRADILAIHLRPMPLAPGAPRPMCGPGHGMARTLARAMRVVPQGGERVVP